jgi:hypothetical protein
MTRDESRDQKQGDQPSDTEALVGDTAASEKLTDRERVQPGDAESREDLDESAEPPRTTRGKFTAPKFGSATSGGGEFEGPRRD